jgi:hypothetical protein
MRLVGLARAGESELPVMEMNIGIKCRKRCHVDEKGRGWIEDGLKCAVLS